MLKIIFNQLNFGQNKKKFSIFQKILIFLIILSSLIVIIETEKEIYNSYNSFFEFCKYFFGVIFLIEYIFRVLSVGYIKKYKSFSGRITYILSFWTLIDLIAIIPFFLSGTNETFLLRLLRLIRLFSVIRVGRYSSALKNVLEAISDRKHELLFAVAISTTVLVISSTFMYLLEAEKQPRHLI
jgi:voltage-gated potassium channel